MAEFLYLGIDIGTSSAKCLAVAEDGTIVAFARHPYHIRHPHEGWAEQNPEDYWLALVEVVNQCVEHCREQGHSEHAARSLAMSTQGDTLIVTDDAGLPLAPAISWMDRRARAEYRELLAETGPGFWYRETGQSLTVFSSACKLRWIIRNDPELRRRVARCCYLPDFLAKRLCGKFATDVPSASWSPLYTPAKRTWSHQVIDLLGIPVDRLPLAVESGTVIAELLPGAAAQLHLGRNVELIAGAFDQAAAARGAGATAGGRRVLSCGTAWVLYSVSDSPIIDELERAPVCCHTSSSEWGMVMPFTGGSAYDWLLRNLANADAESASEAAPPVFIPHLYGGLSPDWRAESKGSILGLTLSHTSQDIKLALMRGLAFEGRRNLEEAERLAGSVGTVRLVGGAGKSDLWPQLIANILNRPIEVTGLLESACYGAAKIAAGSTAAQWTSADRVREFSPVPADVEAEEQRYSRYLKFYEVLLPLYESEGAEQ